MQIRRLMTLNYLNPHEEPATGAILELQVMAARKPDIKINPFVAHKKNAIMSGSDTSAIEDDDYIPLHKPDADADKSSDHSPYIAGTDYKGDLGTDA